MGLSFYDGTAGVLDGEQEDRVKKIVIEKNGDGEVDVFQDLNLSKYPNLYGLDLSLSGIVDLMQIELPRTLVDLYLYDLDIDELASLAASVPNLALLNIEKSNVIDLKPLAGLSKLKYLYAAATPVSDISPLKGLSLIHLNLGGTKVADVSALSDMTSLEYLNLTGTPVVDIAPLSQLTGLEQMYLPKSASSIKLM